MTWPEEVAFTKNFLVYGWNVIVPARCAELSAQCLDGLRRDELAPLGEFLCTVWWLALPGPSQRKWSQYCTIESPHPCGLAQKAFGEYGGSRWSILSIDHTFVAWIVQGRSSWGSTQRQYGHLCLEALELMERPRELRLRREREPKGKTNWYKSSNIV